MLLDFLVDVAAYESVNPIGPFSVLRWVVFHYRSFHLVVV